MPYYTYDIVFSNNIMLKMARHAIKDTKLKYDPFWILLEVNGLYMTWLIVVIANAMLKGCMQTSKMSKKIYSYHKYVKKT